MTKEGCTMCNYPHGFYRTDDLGGQWKRWQKDEKFATTHI